MGGKGGTSIILFLLYTFPFIGGNVFFLIIGFSGWIKDGQDTLLEGQLRLLRRAEISVVSHILNQDHHHFFYNKFNSNEHMDYLVSIIELLHFLHYT